VRVSKVKLREELSLIVFGNRVLRNIFVSKRDGVTGGWKKLRKEVLFTKYYYSDQIKENGRDVRRAWGYEKWI
jgi:hypothetical protein